MGPEHLNITYFQTKLIVENGTCIHSRIHNNEWGCADNFGIHSWYNLVEKINNLYQVL